MTTRETMALAAATVLLAGALLGCRPSGPGSGGSTPVPAADAESPISVLRAWDQRRAAAYAAGDHAALRKLYRRGSVAGDRDVRLLRRYTGRGLRVVGLQTQVLAAEVRAHEPDRIVLGVTERMAAGVAVGPGSRVRLPRGLARDRFVVMVRGDAGWLVAAVREPGPGGPRR